MNLTERQEKILEIIVRRYTVGAVPIGSKTLVKSYNLGVSSATVRNEMSILEKNGYLTQPHTSAGRLPTEKGYRYFVKTLMEEHELSANEQLMIRHQFHQARLEVDQWMKLSATVLAHTTQAASLITPPKFSQCRLKHLELISIHDTIMLIILVLKEGTVKQQILNLDTAYTQDKLRIISHQLTDLWKECDVQTINNTIPTLMGLSAKVAEMVIDTMERINARKSSDMYYDGLLHILEETGLTEGESLQQIVRVFEERCVLDQLVSRVLQQGGMQIIIGGEGEWHNLSHISIILSRYGIDNQAWGALGVMGPMRMPYGRAVSIVRFMSGLMSGLLLDLYGEEVQS
ncbi:MAG: heat-inducible transcription repressor HrcA [Anaerolineaceae bacterium 4572_78]|nr:MAG: heat-inducible transcription repressor HrcA [Anaerolineaceae bacterium 4572_78]